MKTKGTLKAIKGELNGEIILLWNGSDYASGYIVELFKAGEKDEWEQIDFVIKPRCTISGLKNNSTYRFRVSAVKNTNGFIWSYTVKKKL